MGRLSRRFKKLSPILRIVAPIAFPSIRPLLALSRARSQPRIAPEEVATPGYGGGWLPPQVQSFSGAGAAQGGLTGAATGAVFGPIGAAVGGAVGAGIGGYETGDFDFFWGGDDVDDYDDYDDYDEEY